MTKSNICCDCEHKGEEDGEFVLHLCRVCQHQVCEGCMSDHALHECGWEEVIVE